MTILVTSFEWGYKNQWCSGPYSYMGFQVINVTGYVNGYTYYIWKCCHLILVKYYNG